jgi:nucleoside phosphorylase
MGNKSEKSVSKLLREGAKPSLLLTTGFCGGLTADLSAGAVIIASAISYRGQEMLIDSSYVGRVKQALLAGHLPFKEGKLVTTENVIQLAGDKKRLSDNGAIAVDMESGVVCRLAQAEGIECLPLRIVLDERDQALPFTGDWQDAFRVIVHPLLTLRMFFSFFAAGKALRRAIALVVNELVPRSEGCVG